MSSKKDDETGSIISDLGSEIHSINGSIATEPSTASSRPSATSSQPSAAAASQPSAATGPSATSGQTKSTAAATAPTHSSAGSKQAIEPVISTITYTQKATAEPVSTNIEDYKKELNYPICLIAQLELDKSYIIFTRGFYMKEIMVLHDIIDSKRNGVEFILIRTIKNALHTIKVQHIRIHQDDVLFFYTEEQKAELLATFKPSI